MVGMHGVDDMSDRSHVLDDAGVGAHRVEDMSDVNHLHDDPGGVGMHGVEDRNDDMKSGGRAMSTCMP
jgi:hypothetical protein